MEQLSFEALLEDVAAREREAYEWIKPIIRNVCQDVNVHAESFVLLECEDYSSLRFRSGQVMKIKIRARSNYISIKKAWTGDLPESVEWKELKSDNKHVRIELGNAARSMLELITEPIIRAAILTAPKEFDCCQLVEQCSDARQCVHPDKEFSFVCGYRKILASGQVFFGENRNV